MTDRFHTIAAKGVRLILDTAVGHVRRFEVERDGRTITPLHVAPWVDDPAVANSTDPNILPNLKFLAGDFFCAPFSTSDVEPGTPGHGWAGNSEWKLLGETRLADGVTARFELVKKVMGATLVKEITLRDGHPFAYQSHIFTGGRGAVSAASHAMTRFSKEGHLSFSPKQFGELPPMQQESDPARGRSLFARDKRFTDLRKLPLADGSTVDLHHYPVASGHEDFVMLVEAKDSPLGWTAATRPAEGDIMLSLKNPADFPVTFLWFSNGGRYYAPWNSRHLGVLGIEEGRAWGAQGHAASIAPNPLSEAGIPTSITLGPDARVELRHVIGGLPLPSGWTSVFSADASGDGLTITGDTGASVTVPFDLGFVKR
jgi:hypothetical protein